MQENVRYLGANSTRYVAILPNAGLPRNVKGVGTLGTKLIVGEEAGTIDTKPWST